MLQSIELYFRRFGGFVRELIQFGKNPRKFWEELPETDDSFAIVKEIAVWVIPSAAARFLCWGYWHFSKSLLQSLLWYLLLTALILGIGKAIRFTALFFNQEMKDSRALQMSFYSFLPLLVLGILYASPLLGSLVPVAALWGVYMLYWGIRVLIPADQNKHILFTAVIAVLMILGVLAVGALSGGVVLPRF